MGEKIEGWHWPVFGGLGDTLCGLKFAPENITTSKRKLTCAKCKELLNEVKGDPYAPKQTKEKSK